MSRARKKTRGNPARQRVESISTAYPVSPEQQAFLDELDFSDLTYRIGSGQLEGEDLVDAVSLYTLYLWSSKDSRMEEWRRIFLAETRELDEEQVMEYLIEQCRELVRQGKVSPADG